MPGRFGLTIDPATTTFEEGSVLMGGSPIRLMRLSRRATALLTAWNGGQKVGRRKDEQLLARRLVSSGLLVPRAPAPRFTEDDVTVVVPVRDRPEQLEQLLASLQGLHCVVVDDGSAAAARTEEITARFGARFVGLRVNEGPAAARNAGLRVVETPLVAFVDSDCLPQEAWLSPLLGHFDDPLVAAVAPRIVPAAVAHPTALSRYEAVRSSLDRGESDGPVRPHSRIPYVPSATLLVRCAATAQPLFDPALRGGEDVDLVWRLHAAGWDVRYVAGCTVTHAGPQTLRAWLSRRAFYGTTGGPLAQRHPEAMAPMMTSAWTATALVLTAARRPVSALATLSGSVYLLAQRLNGFVTEPVRVATRIAAGGTAKSAMPALAGLSRAWSPALFAGLLFRRTRRAAAAALVAPAMSDWASTPAALDPVRHSALHMADDLAYGSGLWLGCLRERTLRPLVPRIVFRAPVWSARSIRAQLTASESATD